MERAVVDKVLEVQNLKIGYQSSKHTLQVGSLLNFQLEKGELVGLVGANGVGKSTLLRTLSKLQNPLGGSIFLSGKELRDYSALLQAQTLSLVLTEKIGVKNLTVLELIALGRQPYTNWLGTLSGEDRLAVSRALSFAGVEDLKTRKCYELSDGQLQRVMIARALAQDTHLVLLDEPTTHLDVYHKVKILSLLRDIAHETGKTMLFSTHEIDLAIQLCDQIILMEKERMHFGSPVELIQSGAFEYLFPSDLLRFDKETGSFKVVGK